MPTTRYSEGPKTNPLAGALLADTGAFPAGNNVTAQVVLTTNASAGAACYVEQRNAANGANVGPQVVVAAPNRETVNPYLAEYILDVGERVRVIAAENVTGIVSAVLIVNS